MYTWALFTLGNLKKSKKKKKSNLAQTEINGLSHFNSQLGPWQRQSNPLCIVGTEKNVKNFTPDLYTYSLSF